MGTPEAAFGTSWEVKAKTPTVPGSRRAKIWLRFQGWQKNLGIWEKAAKEQPALGRGENLTFLCCLPQLKGNPESLSHGQGDSLGLRGEKGAEITEISEMKH